MMAVTVKVPSPRLPASVQPGFSSPARGDGGGAGSRSILAAQHREGERERKGVQSKPGQSCLVPSMQPGQQQPAMDDLAHCRCHPCIAEVCSDETGATGMWQRSAHP